MSGPKHQAEFYHFPVRCFSLSCTEVQVTAYDSADELTDLNYPSSSSLFFSAQILKFNIYTHFKLLHQGLIVFRNSKQKSNCTKNQP